MNPYHPLPHLPLLFGRQEIMLERCHGKRVLHLGCVDTGVMDERFQRGELMHQRLAPIAAELWGLDINAEGITFLREHGFDNMVVADVCDVSTLEAMQGHEFDVIIASEVMEHLSNPGLFLNGVKTLMTPGITELIISVPNAFRVMTLWQLLRRQEFVHPDHNYWFSYATASTLIRKHGLDIVESYLYTLQPTHLIPKTLGKKTPTVADTAVHPTQSSGRRSLRFLSSIPKRLLLTGLYRLSPYFGDGLIFVARIADGDV